MGSVLVFSWTLDSTLLAVGGASGAVQVCQTVNRTVVWKHITAFLDDNNIILVKDELNTTTEELDFKDRVVDFALGFDHLVVITVGQVHIYHSANWNSPHVEDLNEQVLTICLSSSCFAIVERQAVQIWLYEGKKLSAVKYPGMKTEILTNATLSLSRDTICIARSNQMRFFDVHSARPIGSPIDHRVDVQQVSLSQYGSGSDRKVAMLDRCKDLYISSVHNVSLVKIASMIDSVQWHQDVTDMLAAVGDRQLYCWLYPSAIFLDNRLMEAALIKRDINDIAGVEAALVSFYGSQVTLRRKDGAQIVMQLSPFAPLLYQQIGNGAWEKAARLCRCAKSDPLWAAFATMALQGRQLQAAEEALAAIDEVDKVHYVQYICDLPHEILQQAESLLMCRRPDEGVQLLLNKDLVYRAIKTLLKLHRWEAALDVAVLRQTHVDTVLAYRSKHLAGLGRNEEHNPKFIEIAKEVKWDWSTVKTKCRMEKKQEAKKLGYEIDQ
eukprot:GHVL01024008.1.p1 GENE.GHVL01024008.1~~GHVL01024008.1.p1  ORF type:complete len:496 (+),score=62.76 GHVL01024008.1:911-2398(+)